MSWWALAGAAAAVAVAVPGWLWLRQGHYRKAGESPRLDLRWSPLVIPVTGAGGALALADGWTWLAPALWCYLAGAVLVAWVDLDVHRIPDRVLSVWAPVVLVAALGGAALGGQWSALGSAVATAGALGVLFLMLAVTGSMGLGDVKLAAVTGFVLGPLGWSVVVGAVAAMFGAGALAALWLLVRGASRKTHLAFGPAIIAGAVVAIATTVVTTTTAAATGG